MFFHDDKNPSGARFVRVSAAEITNELPRLSEAEVSLVRKRLIELAAQTDDVPLCDQSALDGAMMLDRLEAAAQGGFWQPFRNGLSRLRRG